MSLFPGCHGNKYLLMLSCWSGELTWGPPKLHPVQVLLQEHRCCWQQWFQLYQCSTINMTAREHITDSSLQIMSITCTCNSKASSGIAIKYIYTCMHPLISSTHIYVYTLSVHGHSHAYVYIHNIYFMHVYTWNVHLQCMWQPGYIYISDPIFIVYTERGCDCLKSCIYISGKLYAAIENCLILIYIFVYLCYNAHFTEWMHVLHNPTLMI